MNWSGMDDVRRKKKGSEWVKFDIMAILEVAFEKWKGK